MIIEYKNAINDNTKRLMTYIRALMILKNISIKEAAQRMNKTQGATSALLKQNNVSLNTLQEICQAIDCDLKIQITPRKSSDFDLDLLDKTFNDMYKPD